MTSDVLKIRVVCGCCDGEGWLPAPVQVYDELDMIPCPTCKGYGVLLRPVYPDFDGYEPYPDELDDYDPFALEEEIYHE